MFPSPFDSKLRAVKEKFLAFFSFLFHILSLGSVGFISDMYVCVVESFAAGCEARWVLKFSEDKITSHSSSWLSGDYHIATTSMI